MNPIVTSWTTVSAPMTKTYPKKIVLRTIVDDTQFFNTVKLS